jgi:hypothetical protein
MEINDAYEIKIENVQHFVYEGTCNNIPTKWVTKSAWNGKIYVHTINKKIKYTDTDGNEILVLDEEDDEYKHIHKTIE